jgi:type I restriction enzyme R subunit
MQYSESDTRSKFIDPALYEQWRQESQIIRERYFTDGRKLPWNKRAKQCFVDYLLKDFGLNLAIVEAKKYGLPPTEGLEQVKDYGRKLDVRWVYSTNGQEIYEFDLGTGLGKIVDRYPTPAELYERYTDEYAVIRQQILSVPYYIDSGKRPRYYQDLAITKTLSALAQGKERILLTLATGTGKTYIAFQIAYKLLMAKWSRNGFNRRPRILFLADRNVLIGQAVNEFNPLEKDCKEIKWSEIKKALGKVPTNANIFFSIYQAIISGSDRDRDSEDDSEYLENPEDNGGWYYRQYDPEFFDLIIIDECHRGGAKDDGNWAEILKYFSSAVQLGMTATPKRKDNIDTYAYFGEAVYEYSLKEGINDGFLTPYKVKRVRTNMDELVIDQDVQIVDGEVKKDIYGIKDFDKNIVVPERTEFIGGQILKLIWTYEKTIIFCVDQEHAAKIRDAINANKTVRDADYCVRVTSNEWENGRTYLKRFQDNDKTIPVILTSSLMLTTWVDAKNVRNIVLLRNIWSMTEFKQIVGRGTRVFEGKDYFTIIDFTGATNLFYDPEWDGEVMPETTEDPEMSDDVIANNKEIYEDDKNDEDNKNKQTKLRVRLNGNRELKIINIETRYIDESGKPMSADEYLKSLLGKLPAVYTSEEQLRTLRADPKTREDLLKELYSIGLDRDQFTTLQRMFDAPDSDVFDILAHLSFSEDIKTKQERASWVLAHSLIIKESKQLQAKEFLEYLLRYYEEYGSIELVQSKISDVIKLYGRGQMSVMDITKHFGSYEGLLKARKEVQGELFRI